MMLLHVRQLPLPANLLKQAQWCAQERCRSPLNSRRSHVQFRRQEQYSRRPV